MSKRPLPQYEILGKDPAPKNLADWQGLRVRAGGGQSDAMEVLGASKQTLPAVETATAFQRGALDATSFPYTYAHVSFGISDEADWLTSNLAPGSSECGCRTPFWSGSSRFSCCLASFFWVITLIMFPEIVTWLPNFDFATW